MSSNSDTHNTSDWAARFTLGLPVIETQRLRLRAYAAGDEEALHAFHSDDAVMCWTSMSTFVSPAETRAVIERSSAQRAAGTMFQWGVADRVEDRVIGMVALYDIQLRHRRADVAYMLARSVWGRGFAREAVAALVDLCFADTDLHRLGLDIDPRNSRSLRLAEALGFAREGLVREGFRRGGEIQDSVLFGLLRREWQGGTL